MKILNLTQHQATPEQIAAGVVNVDQRGEATVKSMLTFHSIPNKEDMKARANTLAAIAEESGCVSAMIGGAPYFMAPLERALKDKGIQPLYAFSVRESVEETQPDGSVIKRNVFKHAGFVVA